MVITKAVKMINRFQKTIKNFHFKDTKSTDTFKHKHFTENFATNTKVQMTND